MIYVFLADDFEEMEAIAPIDLLRRAGVKLQIVGVGGKTVTGRSGITMVCDITEDETDRSICEAVILPGGPGHTKLAKSKELLEIISIAAKQKKLLAAICAAPSILGQNGYLQGKRACCYPGFEETLIGAQIVYGPVVIDGNVITSRGAGTSTDFALAIVSYLVSREKAAEIAAQIIYER